MKRSLIAAAIALVASSALASPVEARRHKPTDAPTVCHNPVDVMRPCPIYFSNGLRSVFRRMGRGVQGNAHAGTVLAGRPAACRGIPWCGCWLRLRKGIADVRLNVARAWAKIGADAGGPGEGVIAVWAHHVGEITAVLGPGRIMLRSGNDGGAVRERPRSTRGVIAWRRV